MSEPDLHLFMKQIVSEELEKSGFIITLEPKYPPSQFINWSNYRPDLVGVYRSPDKTKYAIVECETNPSKTRFDKKNWREIAVQTRLFEDPTIQFILAVPNGNISKVTSFRRFWEIWHINTETEEVLKIPRCTP